MEGRTRGGVEERGNGEGMGKGRKLWGIAPWLLGVGDRRPCGQVNTRDESGYHR